MTKKILLTITPADYYFFGGENTFDDSRGERNYLVRSNRLPQQTALVGLIRHILYLEGKDIGPESFQIDWPGDTPQEFGALHSISPLFLQKKDNTSRHFLVPAAKTALDNGAEILLDTASPAGQGYTGYAGFQTIPRLYFQSEAVTKPDPCKPHAPQPPNRIWTEKERLGDFWVSMSDGARFPAVFEQSEHPKAGTTGNGGIFISSLHIGIDKQSRNNGQGSDDEGFYKQEFLRLAPGYSFAVVAEVDQSLDLSVFCRTMPFGGENRTFSIEAEDWTGGLAEKWQPARAYGRHADRIVLLADAWLGSQPEGVFSLCQLVIGSAKPFRHIRTPQAAYSTDEGEKTYALANLHKKKTELTYLLERGSVLYPQSGKLQDLLDQLLDDHFHNIGYNFFHPQHTTL